jgi:cephalosporin hydroxylase
MRVDVVKAKRVLKAKRAELVTKAAARWAPAPAPVAAPPVAASTENPLVTYFRTNQDRQIYKWKHFFDIYDRHFAPYRGKPVTILEFGVFQGGSLQMWKDYFGPQSRIIGVDINPQCAAFAEDRISIEIGDQEDRDFLRKLGEKYGPIDVLMDDGGHTMAQQIATFEELWPFVSPDGVFMTEDLHTSYWSKYSGGYKRPGTFIEYAKNLIDQQHA